MPIPKTSPRLDLWLTVVCACSQLTSSIATAQEKTDPTPETMLKTFVAELVPITPGTGIYPASCVIGSVQGSPAEKPAHEMQFLRPFSIAKYEVYQSLYQEIMGNNPSRWQGPRNSAERMTHIEAIDFCERMTKRLRSMQLIQPNQVIRLPTESEWEYCARAGTTTRYSFGDHAQSQEDTGKQATILNAYGWHTGNAAGNDPEVGVLKPNPWGLYDVHGYLSEFCSEHWKPSHSADAVAVADQVVIRGGSWKDPYARLTSSFRRPFAINGRDDAVGFRCVLSEKVNQP